jgi:DNA-binding CsgD family transcriptional regulator
VQRVAELARSRRHGLLLACGRERERRLELGVVRQLLEPRLLAAGDAERERLLAGPAGMAAPLLDGRGGGAGAELPGMVHGLYRLLANLAAHDGPLVLAIDDADLADAGTLEVLAYLVPRLAGIPVVLVAATGSAVAAVAEKPFEPLSALEASRRCRLVPLGPSGTAAWVRASFFPDAEDGFCAAVQEATGGVPRLVAELCRELAAAGAPPTEDAAASAAPATVATAAMRRARAVGRGAVPLLQAVAVLGDGASVRNAAALAGIGREQAARLAGGLAAAGVLAAGERLGFAQPLVAAAVHEAIPAGERAEAHRSAALLLREDDAPAVTVAGHLLRAAAAGEGWAVDVLREAARRALARGEPAAAVELLERALREPPPADRRADVLLDLGRAEAVAGAPAALGRLTEAVARLPAAADRARTALDVGRTLFAAGRLDDAAAAFEHGLRVAGEGDGGDVEGLLRAASVAVLRLRAAEAGAAGEPGPEPQRAATATDRALLARLSLDAALRGEPHERVRELAARALARGALLDDSTADGIAYYLAAAALTLAEDLQMAEAVLAAAADDARSRGSALGLATASHFGSIAILRRGRVPAAAAAARTALEGERFGWRLALPSAHAVLAEALFEGGDAEGGRRQVELAARSGRPDAASQVAHLAARARLHLASGRPRQALQDHLDCGELLRSAGAPNPAVMPWRSGAARALAAMGDRSEARRLASEELSLARDFGAPGSTGRALRALASLETGARAVEALQAAVECLEDSQTALERARALVDLGAALRRARRPRDSREPLRRGLDLAQRCGAAELAGRAMREVTAAGARPRRPALHGVEALTPRELQTSSLAAEGLSNREIAEALYVTVKTVEWHLKHSYGKLGISSRRELAAALARPPRPGEHARPAEGA